MPLTIEKTKKYMPRWPIKNYKFKSQKSRKKEKDAVIGIKKVANVKSR